MDGCNKFMNDRGKNDANEQGQSKKCFVHVLNYHIVMLIRLKNFGLCFSSVHIGHLPFYVLG